MLLAVDIGNTHIVLGLMEEGRVLYSARMKTDREKTEHEYAALIRELLSFCRRGFTVDGAAVSSVVPPLTGVVSKALRLLYGLDPIIVGAGVKTGLNIRIDNAGEAGSDLVTSAVGALRTVKPPFIIVDMGTATTFSCVDKNGCFVGGAICPGVGLSLDALCQKASLLPKISLEPPRAAIGRNTVDCMRSGSVLGTAAMVDGMLDRMAEELGGGVTFLATGGNAKGIVPLCRNRIEVREHLIFEGLWSIYRRNQEAAR